MSDNIPTLILIYGPPGCGKSTLARELVQSLTNAFHIETDQYFSIDGEYNWDATKLGIAHTWCQDEAFKAFSKYTTVIVANTFSRQSEFAPYLARAKERGIEVKIITPSTSWRQDPIECYKRCTHNVPLKTIQAMLSRDQQNEQFVKHYRYDYTPNK